MRIENAMTQIKFKIDSDIPTGKQAEECVKKLRDLFPLGREEELIGVLTSSFQFIL
jgi:ribosome maturation protein Sdo1